jgi:tetratricopeptide (TPR) repeat protein
MSQQAQRFVEQATLALQQGDAQQALTASDQAVALAPHSADAHLIRGIALSHLGQAGPATQALNQAIQLSPYDPKGYYNLGLHYFNLGFPQQAAEMARQALRVQSNHAGAQHLLDEIAKGVQPQNPSAPIPPPQAVTNPIGQPAPMYPPAPGDVLPPPVSGPQPPPSESSQQPYGSQPTYNHYPPAPKPAGLPFIRGLGKTWEAAAILLVASGFILFIAMVIHATRVEMPNTGDLLEMVKIMQRDPQYKTLSVMALGLNVLSLLWMILDIADKRASWIWLLPAILCCCCNTQWGLLPIYLLAGRKQ